MARLTDHNNRQKRSPGKSLAFHFHLFNPNLTDQDDEITRVKKQFKRGEGAGGRGQRFNSSEIIDIVFGPAWTETPLAVE